MFTPENLPSNMKIEHLQMIMKWVRRSCDYERELEFLKIHEINQQQYPAIDSKGIRWCKCKHCGKIDNINEFITYGGKGHVNIGTCYSCRDLDLKEYEDKIAQIGKREVTPGNACPYCGSKVVRRKGMYGDFWGCSSYPECRFTAKITSNNQHF